MILIEGLKKIGGVANGFGFAQHQQPHRFESVMKGVQYFLLRLVFEINQQVLATDQVHVRERRVLEKVMRRKNADVADAFNDLVIAIRLDEETSQPLDGNIC